MDNANSCTQENLGKPLSPDIHIVPLGTENIIVNFSLSGKSGDDIILTPETTENQDSSKSTILSEVESDVEFFSDPKTTNKSSKDKRV